MLNIIVLMIEQQQSITIKLIIDQINLGILTNNGNDTYSFTPGGPDFSIFNFN